MVGTRSARANTLGEAGAASPFITNAARALGYTRPRLHRRPSPRCGPGAPSALPAARLGGNCALALRRWAAEHGPATRLGSGHADLSWLRCRAESRGPVLPFGRDGRSLLR